MNVEHFFNIFGGPDMAVGQVTSTVIPRTSYDLREHSGTRGWFVPVLTSPLPRVPTR